MIIMLSVIIVISGTRIPYTSAPPVKHTEPSSETHITVIKPERILIEANGLQFRQVYSSLSFTTPTLKHERITPAKALLSKLK